MEIYAEYFFLENLIADSIIAALTLRLWRKKTDRWRFYLAVLLMTLYSFSVFVPDSALLNSLPAKTVFSLIVVKILFYDSDKRMFSQAAVTFLGVSLAMGGTVTFALYILGTKGISSSGTMYVYPSSYPAVLICIAASYFFIKVFFLVLTDNRKKENLIVEIELGLGAKSCGLKAFIDTGNTLKDPVGGRPVMIGEAESVRSIIEDNYDETKIRLIPYCSVGLESGTLIGVEIDSIVIKDGNREYRGMPAVLAVYNGKFGFEDGCSIILHPDILEKGGVRQCC
ncbi:MAG: sigma-E processing peptidase SpoIIGA [Firmicutes bacterium]|nr:sigma-E processing peptidase SpoIIGA [Bacillota bacterium]